MFARDGADTTDPEMGGATFSNFNVDAIQEVQGRFMNPVVCVSRGKATTIGNLLTQGNRVRKRSARRKSPAQTRPANNIGERRLNQASPTRTLLAAAPPKYTVSKIAPRMEVRGITHNIVHASSVMPMPTIVDSG